MDSWDPAVDNCLCTKIKENNFFSVLLLEDDIFTTPVFYSGNRYRYIRFQHVAFRFHLNFTETSCNPICKCSFVFDNVRKSWYITKTKFMIYYNDQLLPVTSSSTHVLYQTVKFQPPTHRMMSLWKRFLFRHQKLPLQK